MSLEPAYVRIAGELAREIRSGELCPGTQLPSQTEMATHYGVSGIVIRQAIALLRRLQLVDSRPRRGTFVAAQSGLVRVSPERQMESAEKSWARDAGGVKAASASEQSYVDADAEVAEALGVRPGTELSLVVKRTLQGGARISISDTYTPLHVDQAATMLEETIADEVPSDAHRAWLETPPGELVRTVRQRFLAGDRPVMVSYVTYPRDHFKAMTFLMSLAPETS